MILLEILCCLLIAYGVYVITMTGYIVYVILSHEDDDDIINEDFYCARDENKCEIQCGLCKEVDRKWNESC